MLIRLIEDQTRGKREDVDPLGFAPELHHHIRLLEVGRSQPQPTEAELLQRSNDALSVRRGDPHPNVEVLRVPGVSVGGERVPADD